MKFKKGDKVIIKSKHGEKSRLSESTIYTYLKNNNIPYGYVNDITYVERLFRTVYVINCEIVDIQDGDFFDEIDLESYLKFERKQKLEKLNEKGKIKC